MNLQTDAQDNLPYQMPPKDIANLIDAPPTPGATLSPSKEWMLLLDRPNLPSIEAISQEELRLAGIRINPKTNGSSRSFYYSGMRMRSVDGQKEIPVQGLPAQPQIENTSWSPNGDYIAFTITVSNGMELWAVDTRTAQARKLTEAIINDAMRGLPYRWFSDNKSIVYKSVNTSRGSSPEESQVPAGPTIQENKGKSAPVRTYQDLLKNAHDEALFEYYTSSQLMLIDLESNQKQKLGDVSIINALSPSPDGRYIMVTRMKKPFSYIVPYSRFPFTVDIYDKTGKLVKQVADIPIAENIPKGFGAVRTGPRSFSWRTDAPATLYWVEAQDEGDPKKEANIRDQLFMLEAPFTTAPQKGLAFKLRYGGVDWGTDELAIAYEWWWQNRQVVTSRWWPNQAQKAKEVIFDRSWEDSYNDPGEFETHRNQYGRQVLLTTADHSTLYLTGRGASPEGNRPFVDQFDLATKESNRLWRSEAPYYEYPISIVDENKGIVLTRRESTEEPPNYFLRDLKAKDLTQITHFEHPYASLKDIQKELIKYKRADGIELTGTLYLPAGYNKERDGRLPVLMWAYPREFKSADAAGQVKDSPYEFIRIGWWSPIFWVNQGYAVLDDFGMPIIGEGDEEPNETFIEQLVSGAEAAINKLDEMGVADTDRLAVGGHSYGAFMTANLLAHSDLFAAGIARSGAYNRTLTPFGFQSEERTFWEASDTYFKMSPFMHADKIKEPLLLIHGEADNNSGTFPMQSERFYGALKGHGAPVRLVMLPHESHGYRARESIMHMLWEMNTWLDVHVKNRKLEMEEVKRSKP
ncbi:MAG: prolyl oligopeptidase family serine peptidase [Bacteroidota bacterium]